MTGDADMMLYNTTRKTRSVYQNLGRKYRDSKCAVLGFGDRFSGIIGEDKEYVEMLWRMAADEVPPKKIKSLHMV